MPAVLVVLGLLALYGWWASRPTVSVSNQQPTSDGLPVDELGAQEDRDAATEGAAEEPVENDVSEPKIDPVQKSSFNAIPDSAIASPYHVFLQQTPKPEIE